MKDTLISVIVPAYNIASYVEKSIRSICAQSHQNLEIIVVNDGSTDDTLAVLNKMAQEDKRIRVISKENGGVTSARLRGIAEAKGEWIGFVDGDDYIEPDMYERLLKNAVKHQAQISHCGYQMVFPKGHVDYYYNTGRLEKQKREQAVKALIEGTYIEPSLCCKLFRNHLFSELINSGVMNNGIRNTEDFLMNYYLFREADQCVYEDFCAYHYMLRPSSAATSGISEHKLKDPIRVLRILLQETKENPEVYTAAWIRYIRMLIGRATMDDHHRNEMVLQHRSACRAELRAELKSVLASDHVPVKLKVLTLWAGLLPGSYRFVHQTYAKIKGIDQIYSLDK